MLRLGAELMGAGRELGETPGWFSCLVSLSVSSPRWCYWWCGSGSMPARGRFDESHRTRLQPERAAYIL